MFIDRVRHFKSDEATRHPDLRPRQRQDSETEPKLQKDVDMNVA